MTRFWVSWWQSGEDYRPLAYPPNEAILGWWHSGSRDTKDGKESSLCALVEVADEQASIAAVQKDWPEAVEFRFINEVIPGFVPGDRFPLLDWMKARI